MLMLRLFGAGTILLTLASAVSAGERYIEVWNPPEARGALQHTTSSHKQATRSHASARPVRFHARRAPAPLPKMVAKRSRGQDELRPTEPDALDIPRQVTPEGNILRVDSRRAYVRVVR